VPQFGVLRRWTSAALTEIERRKALADEQVVKLLEEIGDLQKAYLENQKRALRRQKINLFVFTFFLVVFLSFMAYMGWSAGH
jgi:hypothetical protein